MIKVDNQHGSIHITTDVFTSIAGDAATRCFGVKGMAGRSKSDGLVHLLRRESMSKGVVVHFDEDGSLSIELHIVVDHGVNLNAVGTSIIEEVNYKVSHATGVSVSKVQVFIDSMVIG